MADLVVTVSVACYRATVHHSTCDQLNPARYFATDNQIPATARVRLCKWCKPTVEEATEIAEELDWETPRNPSLQKVRYAGRMGFEIAEQILARAQYGNGKIAPHTGGARSGMYGSYGDSG